jgi:hypothetical protein
MHRSPCTSDKGLQAKVALRRKSAGRSAELPPLRDEASDGVGHCVDLAPADLANGTAPCLRGRQIEPPSDPEPQPLSLAVISRSHVRQDVGGSQDSGLHRRVLKAWTEHHHPSLRQKRTTSGYICR